MGAINVYKTQNPALASIPQEFSSSQIRGEKNKKWDITFRILEELGVWEQDFQAIVYLERKHQIHLLKILRLKMELEKWQCEALRER